MGMKTSDTRCLPQGAQNNVFSKKHPLAGGLYHVGRNPLAREPQRLVGKRQLGKREGLVGLVPPAAPGNGTGWPSALRPRQQQQPGPQPR